jgi:hypothetical protein
VTEPDRDLSLDISDDVLGPVETGPKGASPDAPYGYKKDGTPAKKRGRQPGSTNSTTKQYAPRRTSGSIENQIGAFLFTINAPLQLFLSNDALDAVEIQALAHALDQECSRNARFKKYVEQALAVQGGTSLVLVIASIVGRRVVRHRLVEVPEPIGNEGLDAMLGGIISMTTGKGPINPNLFSMKDQETT